MKIAILTREMNTGKGPWARRFFVLMEYYKMAIDYDFELVAIMSGCDCEEVCSLCDGLIIPGSGKDIDPKYYGGTPFNPPQEIDEYALDSKVMEIFLKQKKPIFGICGGHQDINVYFGGNIVKRQKTETYDDLHDADNKHVITIEKDSFVYDVFGSTEATVNSWHNWVLGEVAPNLKVVAREKHGGLIEAVEDKEKMVFGVQWHPEMSYNENTIERKFFENFIKLCKENKKA